MPSPVRFDVSALLSRAGKLTEGLASGAPALAEVAAKAKAALLTQARPIDGKALRETLQSSPRGLAGGQGAFDPSGFVKTGSPPAPVPEGARFEPGSFTGEGGHLTYKIFIPSGAGSEERPLVVMLHGCTQSPDDFARGTGMNALAEREGAYVVYPAQSREANAQKCWNWFRHGDQQRDRGEPALIVGLVRALLREHRIDPRRVYVAGLSAGGAAAAVLGQIYPEIFAAVGVHSGLACGAASDMSSAFAAMRGSGAAPPAGATFVPTIVFHGDQDSTVSPINGLQVIAQAAGVTHLQTTIDRGRSAGGVAYTRTVQVDAAGVPMLEHWVLHGAGHVWSGGDPAGSYTDARGPDASAAMLRFFAGHAQRR